MNIVFLSNERHPLQLEQDDRRHCVVWSPPPPPISYFEAVNREIEAGGVAALHHYLLNLDLGDFGPAARPPMSGSKSDLIRQSASSEDRFIADWRGLEVEAKDGGVLPFCPCLGADLYRAYQLWCDRHGERRRRMQELIGFCGKLNGWTAGRPSHTWRNFNDTTKVMRRLVIPNPHEVTASVKLCTSGTQERLVRDAHESDTHWLTAGFFAFNDAIGPGP